MSLENRILLSDISKATARIHGYAYRTPTYKSYSEASAWLKLECFQPTRSFKIRGAANKILSLPEDRLGNGVITASSGNHGLAVAYVANKLEIDATIVLPENVVPEKLAWIKSLGAKIVLFGKQQDERQRKANEIQKSEGYEFIQPFNDLEIITGQGTCGLELIEDVPYVENIFVPIGGGGLISGVALAAKLERPSGRVKVIGVQPEGSPSMFESFQKHEITTIKESRTIADGLSVRRPGDITFEFVKRYVDRILLVSDEEILDTTRQLIKQEHVLVEPSGAAAFAGLMKSRKENIEERTQRSVAIVSGGNISYEILERIMKV
ncbi:MAG TPA: threonine/serine dehydratase [Nitrososphaerales archaeon]|nr:threonine/serine dehydratase [Nitrososphaerales archaeon]